MLRFTKWICLEEEKQQHSMRMRRGILALATALAIASVTPAIASTTPTIAGTKCARAGLTRTVAKTAYVCRKSGKLLKWRKKVQTSTTEAKGVNGPVGHSSWTITASPNPVRPSQPVTLTATITCGPILSLSGSPRYPDMNAWINDPNFRDSSMGVPVLSNGGNTATFTLKTTAPSTEGTVTYYAFARDYGAPNGCFGIEGQFQFTKSSNLVVSSTAAPTATVPPGTQPKDLGPCAMVGDTYALSVGYLECRQFSDDSLKWVTLSKSPTAPSMVAGGTNHDSCRLREARAVKYQPWNVGFPRGDSYGTPTLPTSGVANVQLVAIEFPDALGTAKELVDVEAQIAEFNKWFAFTSNGTLSFNWQFPKQWFRMSKPVPDYGFKKSVRDKVEQIASEMIAISDPVVNYSNSDFVFVLFPRSIKLGEPDVGMANYNLQSAEGRIKNLFGGSEYFYNNNFELWSFWIHEWGHPMGLAGHTPRSNISIMDNQNGSSVVLNAWDAFFSGWLGPDQLYCMPQSQTSLEMSLIPLERNQHGPRGIIVPLSATNALVIESHRAEGWGTRMGAGRYGVAVYWIDTTTDTNRYAGSSGYTDTDAGDRWADHVVPSGKSRTFDLLLAGDTVTYKGVTVSFTKTGDVDTIRITR